MEPKLALSPDETWLAVASGNSVEVMDVGHGLSKCFPSFADELGVAFTPDSRRLWIVPSETVADLFDIATGLKVPVPLLPREQRLLSMPFFSPSGGAMFAITRGTTSTLVRWEFDRAGGIHEVATTTVPNESKVLALSDDERLLAVATKENAIPQVQIFRAARLTASSAPSLSHKKPDERVLFAAFADASKALLTGSLNGRWRLWNLAEVVRNEIVLEPDLQTRLDGAAYSRDKQLLLIFWGKGKGVEVRELFSTKSERVAQAVAGRNLTDEEWNESPLKHIKPRTPGRSRISPPPWSEGWIIDTIVPFFAGGVP